MRGDGTRTSSTSLAHQAGASASRLSGRGHRGRATKATGRCGRVLLGVVLVEEEVELVLGAAHAIGAVVSGSAIAGHARARSVPADQREQVGIVVTRDGILHDTSGGIRHALTQVLVRGRRQGGLGGSPGAVDGRATLQGSVGRGIGGLVHTRGGGAGDVLRVGGEVGKLADTGAVDDRHKTYTNGISGRGVRSE